MSTGPIDTSADVPKDVNGRSIWPNWANQQEWQNRVHHEAVRKALDLPSDDMQIVQNKSGIGTAGAIGIAAAAGVPAAVAAAAMAYSMAGGNGELPIPPSPTPIVAPADLADSEYEIRFYDKDGNAIPVPHVSELKQ